MKTCHAGKQCSQKNCVLSHDILSHWRDCMLYKCKVCSSLRKPVSEDVQAFFEFAQWKNEIVKRFYWLIKMGGLPFSQKSTHLQIVNHQQRIFKLRMKNPEQLNQESLQAVNQEKLQ